MTPPSHYNPPPMFGLRSPFWNLDITRATYPPWRATHDTTAFRNHMLAYIRACIAADAFKYPL